MQMQMDIIRFKKPMMHPWPMWGPDGPQFSRERGDIVKGLVGKGDMVKMRRRGFKADKVNFCLAVNSAIQVD